MKKFFAILLSFVMLFSLTMPAMAAEGDTTITGGTTGDVNASFNPGTIEFTGITIDDTWEDDYRYDEDSKTYTIIIPADDTSPYVEYRIVGNNLKYIDDTNTLLKLKIENEDDPYEYTNADLVLMFQEYGYYLSSIYQGDGHWEKWSYSNDGGTTWTTYTFEVKQAYSITNGTVADANGTIEVPTYALAGDIVPVTVTPATDYELDTLKVMQGETEIEVTDNSFEMPEGAVTVTATFKKSVVNYTVTCPESVDNGSVTVDPSEYTAGQTVTLTVTPESGYELDTLTVSYTDAEGVEQTITPTQSTEEGKENQYTFTMPEGNVTVSASFKKITYAINIGTFEGGSVTASIGETTVTAASENDTVTLTVTTTGIYQLKNIIVKDASSNTVDFASTGEASGIYTFVMPASAVTVEATFEEVRIVAADISWGSLAYTYTTDDGWKNNSTDANAGTVTVTNNGNVSFYTKATYSAELDFMNIRGTFDNGVTLLEAGKNQSFKLTLNNEPAKIFENQKIGTVTVHISETEFEDVATVATEADLLNALANGVGTIKFSSDITLSEVPDLSSDVVIDLNSCSLTWENGMNIRSGATVSISNGVVNGLLENRGNLTVDNCTINARVAAVVIRNWNGGTAKISNTTINGNTGYVFANGGTVELDADVTLSSCYLRANGGTITCHFNPSGKIYQTNVITDNGDGTWTVTNS